MRGIRGGTGRCLTISSKYAENGFGIITGKRAQVKILTNTEFF